VCFQKMARSEEWTATMRYEIMCTFPFAYSMRLNSERQPFWWSVSRGVRLLFPVQAQATVQEERKLLQASEGLSAIYTSCSLAFYMLWSRSLEWGGCAARSAVQRVESRGACSRSPALLSHVNTHRTVTRRFKRNVSVSSRRTMGASYAARP
jgi:hypothetical protein